MNRSFGGCARPDVAVAFPDDGAAKRFGKLFPDKTNIIICGKVRDGEKRIVKVQDGSLEGVLNVVIVDDLVQTGSTLIECAKVLRQASGGRAKVHAYVTHAVFPKLSWKRFVEESPRPVDKFWITDSRPLTVKEITSDKAANEVFEVLSLAPLIANHMAQ
jgi:phosphoribosylpyrophosphate synthetase